MTATVTSIESYLQSGHVAKPLRRASSNAAPAAESICDVDFGSDAEFEQMHTLMSRVLFSSARATRAATYWERNAHAFLIGLGFHVAHKIENATLEDVAGALSAALANDVAALLREMRDDDIGFAWIDDATQTLKHSHPAAFTIADTMLTMEDPAAQATILATAMAPLAVYLQPAA